MADGKVGLHVLNIIGQDTQKDPSNMGEVLRRLNPDTPQTQGFLVCVSGSLIFASPQPSYESHPENSCVDSAVVMHSAKQVRVLGLKLECILVLHMIAILSF